MVANLIGSVFNTLYNQIQIQPLLSEAQPERFEACWQVFNLVVYPLAALCWTWPILWLRSTHRALLRGETVEPARLEKAQRVVVNLP